MEIQKGKQAKIINNVDGNSHMFEIGSIVEFIKMKGDYYYFSGKSKHGDWETNQELVEEEFELL
jgi:hypothetical protein